MILLLPKINPRISQDIMFTLIGFIHKNNFQILCYMSSIIYHHLINKTSKEEEHFASESETYLMTLEKWWILRLFTDCGGKSILMSTDSFASSCITVTFHLPPSFLLPLFPAFTHQTQFPFQNASFVLSSAVSLCVFFQSPSQTNLANSTPMTPVHPIHISHTMSVSLFFPSES